MSTDNTAQNPGPDDLPPPVFVAPDPPDSSQYFSNPIVEADAVRTLRDAFWRLFIGRRDTFGKRWRGSDGAPRQNEAITNEILEDHLEGRYAVHVYPQNVTDRGVKICVLDVDCHRTVPEDEVDDRAQSNFTYIEAIWRQLREMGLPVLLEDSNGRGGFHLWMFVDNLSNREAIGVTAWMASRADAGNLKVECYPGGNEISDDGFGTCIRLPGRHHTEPYFSRFWTGAGWIDAGAVVALLEQIQPVPASGLPEEALTFQPPPSTGTNGRRTTQQRAWTDPAVPPCHVIQEALTFLGPDYYDATRAEWIQIGIGIHSCVRSPEESEEYFQRFKVWSQQAPSRWNEQEAQRDWDSFRPDGLLQWRNPIRLAMDNGYEPPEQWHPDLSRHLHLDIVNAVPYERPPLTGEEGNNRRVAAGGSSMSDRQSWSARDLPGSQRNRQWKIDGGSGSCRTRQQSPGDRARSCECA
jgi:hypothetical protein